MENRKGSVELFHYLLGVDQSLELTSREHLIIPSHSFKICYDFLVSSLIVLTEENEENGPP